MTSLEERPSEINEIEEKSPGRDLNPRPIDTSLCIFMSSDAVYELINRSQLQVNRSSRLSHRGVSTRRFYMHLRCFIGFRSGTEREVLVRVNTLLDAL